MKIRMVLSLVVIIALLIAYGISYGMPSAAAQNEEVNMPPIGANLPPIRDFERGNPKLEFVLVQLIQSEKRGEAASFTRQSAIRLRDGKVLVTIYVMPGQAEMAAKAAISAGATMTSSIQEKGFSAFVPITSLDALANEKTIYRIEDADDGQPAQ